MTNELNRPAARVYYTGDVANRDGWFTVAPTPNAREVRLVEEPGERSEGRVITVFPSHIGDVYAGHCNPRFVTEAAYDAFHAKRVAELAAVSAGEGR